MHEALGELLGVILTGLAGWGMAALSRWLKAKTDNDTAAHVMFVVNQLVDVAVRDVEQTKAKHLRTPEGKLTAGARETAKMAALDKTVELLGKAGTKRLRESLGLTDGAMLNMLSSQIEARVHRLRKGA